MSRELTVAEKAILSILAEKNSGELRSIVDQIVQPQNMVSAGATIAPTDSVTNTSVTIPASYQVGKKYDLGVYLGHFDMGAGVGEKPIFVFELTDPMTFKQTVANAGKLDNGYKADYLTYDAYVGLREGKTVIAPFDMVWKAYESKEEGQLEKMFEKAGWVLSSSSRPANPYGLRIADFRDGVDYGEPKDITRAPSLLVRAGL